MMIRHKTLLGVMGLSGILVSSTALAQQIDYSGLEELFGEPVTISATGKPQRVSETPVSMEILTSEEIRRSGAMDIPQLLQRFAGVEVTRNFKGDATVSIRGYNQPWSNKLLVLVNGRQVYMDNYGMVTWEAIPTQMSEIKQIELVRGPNTSLFGFNAASGVINIVTFDPLLDDVDNATARVGTQHHREGSYVQTFSPNERLGIRFSAGKLLSDDYSRDKMAVPVDEENAFDRESLNLDMAYRISPESSLRVESGYSQNQTDYSLPFNTSLTVNGLTRYYKAEFNHDAGKAGVWTAKVFRNEFDMGLDGSAFVNEVQQDAQKNRLHVGQISALFTPAAKHTLRFSTEARHSAITGDAVGVTYDDEFSFTDYSANAMWDWRITDDVTFTNSIRQDFWSINRDGEIVLTDSYIGINSPAQYRQHGQEFTYNSGVVYKDSPVSRYRFSFARGVHIPSLTEFGRGSITQSEIGLEEIYGNPYLEPESNFTIDASYKREFPEQNLYAEATVFHEEISNVIAHTIRLYGVIGGTGGERADLTFENVGDSEANGVELVVGGEIPRYNFDWQANYTFTLIDDAPDGLPDHYIDHDSNQPRHKVNLTAGYTNGPWELNTDMHYVSGVDYEETVIQLEPRFTKRVDDYFTLNARLGYKLWDTTWLSLDGYNLAQKHFERPTYSLLGSSGGTNEIGRTVLFTVRHEF